MRNSGILLAAAALLAGATLARAQDRNERIALDLRGGGNVPTFDITDAARTGPSFGAGISYAIGPRVSLLADVDFGFHPGASVGPAIAGPDVRVFHFFGKLGYRVTTDGSPWAVVLNAGAGAMRFNIDGVAPARTYPGINVGAKISYRLTPNVSFLLSPQGDIAFSKTAELGTSNSWVWPFTAGLRIQF